MNWSRLHKGMSEIHAYRTDDVPALSSGSRSATVTLGARAISVEITDTAHLSAVRADWTSLLARADAPNVFMDPVLVRVAAGLDPAVRYCALRAWRTIGGERQLVGLWCFAVARPRQSALPMRLLNAPPCLYSYLATPVIDRSCIDETLDAMLDCIAADRRLPKIVALDAMAAEGRTYEALVRVLARRSSAPCILQQSRRPKLQSALDGKAYLEKALSSSTRKKLRQHRRRLSEKGAVTSVIASEPEAVRRAFQDFLALEASGWKGREGTALLSDKADAAFMREAVGALAELGCASIHSLCLDGKAVSIQLVARAGAAAFTWKTAYDEALQDFSPGTLLLEDYTAAFLADKSIAFVDSCSFDDRGYMSSWSERQPVVDLWIDARLGGSLTFRVLSGAQKSYRWLRAGAKSAYLAFRNFDWPTARKR
jgi:CelD/BcsL family acetyltransferase involved in cellulose biosynthesis